MVGDFTIKITPTENLHNILNPLEELLSRSTIDEVEEAVQLADKYVDYQVKTKTIRVRLNRGLIPNYGINYKVVPDTPELSKLIKTIRMKDIISNNTITVEEKVKNITQSIEIDSDTHCVTIIAQIYRMSVKQFKKIIEATDAYYQPEDRTLLKEDSIIVVLRFGSEMRGYPNVRPVNTRKFKNNGIKVSVLFFELENDYPQDMFRRETSMGDWFRVCRSSITNINEWLTEFEEFFNLITKKSDVIELNDWTHRSNYPPLVFEQQNDLNRYSSVIIIGPSGIGKTTLAKLLLVGWTDKKRIVSKLSELTGDGIVKNVTSVNVNEINNHPYRTIITTTSEDVFNGLKYKLKERILTIRLTDIPYLTHSILKHKELIL